MLPLEVLSRCYRNNTLYCSQRVHQFCFHFSGTSNFKIRKKMFGHQPQSFRRPRMKPIDRTTGNECWKP